jgi:hypothetical protein
MFHWQWDIHLRLQVGVGGLSMRGWLLAKANVILKTSHSDMFPSSCLPGSESAVGKADPSELLRRQVDHRSRFSHPMHELMDETT